MDDKIKQIIKEAVQRFDNTDDKIKQIIKEAVQRFDNTQEDPRLLILGATGVGKSSLINAIFGKKLHPTDPTVSTTRKFTTNDHEIAGTTIQITDSPGYGEIGHDEAYSASVVREAATHHAVTLVLKADEKGYERDRRIIGKAGRDPEFSLEKPLLIALNQIDKIKPSREWSPPYEWDSPPAGNDTAKTRNIKEKVSLVEEQFKTVVGDRALHVIPTMADEEEGAIFGVDRFKLCLFEILSEAAKYRFARTAKLAEKASRKVLEQLDRTADTVIKTEADSAASVVRVNPVPVLDIAFLAPLQIGMIIKLSAIYGKTIDWNSAIEVRSDLGPEVPPRSIFGIVISLIPVVKNVLGPRYAAAATKAMGKAAKAYFKGQGVPSPEELRGEVERELRRRLTPEQNENALTAR